MRDTVVGRGLRCLQPFSGFPIVFAQGATQNIFNDDLRRCGIQRLPIDPECLLQGERCLLRVLFQLHHRE